MRRFKLVAVLAMVMVLCSSGWAATGSLVTYPKFKAWSVAGRPLAGGLLYSYVSGSSTAKALYSEKTLTTAHANPIVLDSNGEASIYGNGTYKLVLKTSSGVTLWTMDPVSGIGGAYGTNVATYGSVCAAVTAMGTLVAQTLLIDDNVTEASGCTVPSNIATRVENGGTIAISSGKTLKFNGPFDAGLYNIFNGTGTVRFGPSSTGVINVEWFGNDLTKAYDAAWSQQVVKMNTTGPYYLSDTIYQCKVDVQIIGLETKSSQVFPTDTITATRGIVFGDNGSICDTKWPTIVAAAQTSGNSHLLVKNVNLTGRSYTDADKLSVGIEVKSSSTSSIKESTIQYMSSYGIYVNGTETTNSVPIWHLKIEDCFLNHNKRGIYAYKNGNANMTEAMHVYNTWVNGAAAYMDYGVKLYNNSSTATLTVSFHDTGIEGGNETCFHSAGNVKTNWYGGFIEGTVGSNQHISLASNSSMNIVGSWVGNGDVDVDGTSRLTAHDTTFNQNEINRVSTPYVIGKITDDVYNDVATDSYLRMWGPPNMPVQKDTYTDTTYAKFQQGTVWRDVFGNTWQLMNDGQDGVGKTQRWRAVGGEMVIPIDYANMNTYKDANKMMVWWAQDTFVMTEAEFLVTLAWTGSAECTMFSLGNDTDNNDTINSAQLTGSELQVTDLAIQAKSNAQSPLYNHAHFKMIGMYAGMVEVGKTTTYPMWTDNYRNYIATYQPAGCTWTTGRGILRIKGYYTGQIGWGT